MKVCQFQKIKKELEQNYESVKKENDTLKADLEEALKRSNQKATIKSKIQFFLFNKRKKI